MQSTPVTGARAGASPLVEIAASVPEHALSVAARQGARLLPGVGLCLLVTAAAKLVEAAEHRLFGRAWLESLVLAILIGTAVRTLWTPGVRWRAGVAVCAKTVLEIAVVLLGAAVSGASLLAVGPALLAGIFAVVAAAIGVSYVLGRAFGLSARMATLVACGNSICGNSAIAAVAPVIGAEADDIAAAIAFTAVLGVVAVLGLPLLAVALHLSGLQSGVLAGLTVYAVPQVLAATAPLGAVALQVGTLVKLCRVMMLGPVCVALALVARRPRAPIRGETSFGEPPHGNAHGRGLAFGDLVPWFILGFLALVFARSLNLIPAALVAPAESVAGLLTVVSMAALGLGVDVRAVAKAGGGVVAAVCLSLLALCLISLGLIHMLRLS
jgi:uncharacterized integral membrane protein (TIGR00698 family)